jgi:hypothetical protein
MRIAGRRWRPERHCLNAALRRRGERRLREIGNGLRARIFPFSCHLFPFLTRVVPLEAKSIFSNLRSPWWPFRNAKLTLYILCSAVLTRRYARLV